jgi:hypothetical protein
MSGEFLVLSGEGQAYSEDEADEWLAKTGWRKLERKPLAGPSSLIVAEATGSLAPRSRDSRTCDANKRAL